MQDFLTPKYRHDKLINPTDADLIDVFVDAWESFVFSKVDLLLRDPHGDIAAMAILAPYFEAIWCYKTGESSERRSRSFFRNGFLWCHQLSGSSDQATTEKVVDMVYTHLRCGLAHGGTPTYKINYSRNTMNVIVINAPTRSDGTRELKGLVVNPIKLLHGARKHFRDYVGMLREGKDQDALDCFRRTAVSTFGVGQPDNEIGVSPEQLLNGVPVVKRP